MAEGHEDPMLAEAWAGLEAHPERPASFLRGDNLVMADAFPEGSGIPWQVVIVVPEEDFFGAVKKQAIEAAGVAIFAALVSVFLGVFFANRVSDSLRLIADELGRIGRFELGGAKLPQSSLVREVNDMAEATDAMKSSLKSFGRYVPKDLVSEMLRTGTEAKLGGDKKELTMLFSDIAGFTSVAETMEPDELVELLADYLEAMSDCIKDNGGTVDKFIGDAIMAFWGAPRDLSDHAAHACRAALAMRARLSRLLEEWDAMGRPRFETRIGLNTGGTLVGNIGAPERLNYTAMGDSVNLASRLENLNKSYGTHILCGDATVKAAGDGFVFRPVDWVAVKGKKRGILISELVGLSDEVDDSIKAAVEEYRAALDLYRARKFDEAATRFDEAGAAFGGNDGPSDTMAARARTYTDAPPPDDWDGTFVMTSK
jgi:adenylate cyclase